MVISSPETKLIGFRSDLTTNSDSIPTSSEGKVGGFGGTEESTRRKYAPPSGAIDSKSKLIAAKYALEGKVVGMTTVRLNSPVELFSAFDDFVGKLDADGKEYG